MCVGLPCRCADDRHYVDGDVVRTRSRASRASQGAARRSGRGGTSPTSGEPVFAVEDAGTGDEALAPGEDGGHERGSKCACSHTRRVS